MKRFIFLTFGFLALGFYELSGGNDFDPNAARIAAIDLRHDRDEIRLAELAAPNFEVAEATQVEDTVTRANLNLVSFAAVSAEAPVDPAPQPEKATSTPQPAVVVAPVEFDAETGEAFSVASLNVLSDVAPKITFAGQTTTAASEAVVVNDADIRSVTGSLVNMRSGPGTSYDVVDQLGQGAEVEILSDSGTGWVELRPLDGGPSGWMADFLLTDS